MSLSMGFKMWVEFLPVHSLLVTEDLVSKDLGQEEVVRWFIYVVASYM